MVDQSISKTDPWKRMEAIDQDGYNIEISAQKESQDITIDGNPEEVYVLENDEIKIS